MNEMYWITRLDGLHNIFDGCILFSLFAIIIFIIVGIKGSNEYLFLIDVEKNKLWVKISKKVCRNSVIVLIFAILGAILIPTTKEALLIYGVGGTIDYIQSNPKAMKIPDKCIEAIDKYLDEINNSKKGDE